MILICSLQLLCSLARLCKKRYRLNFFQKQYLKKVKQNLHCFAVS